MDVQIDKFGRIVIPKPVRDTLGLEAGTTLHLETTERESGEREIALRPEREEALFVRKGQVCVYMGKPAEGTEPLDAVASVKAARRARTRQILGLEE
jgi:AbrB family looped-hinge helix DNA binding protein